MVSSLDQDELLNPSSRPASKRRSKTRASDPSRDLDLIVRIDSTLFDQHSPDVPLPSLGLLPPTITRIYNGSTRWLLAQLSAPDLGSASASESPPPSQPLVHLPRLSSHPTQLEEDGDSANSSELDDCGSDNNSDSHLDESHSGETPEELHAPSTLSPTLLAKRTEPPAPTELSPQRVSGSNCTCLCPFRSGISLRSSFVSFSLSIHPLRRYPPKTNKPRPSSAYKRASKSEM